jgi:hypothetical protein
MSSRIKFEDYISRISTLLIDSHVHEIIGKNSCVCDIVMLRVANFLLFTLVQKRAYCFDHHEYK